MIVRDWLYELIGKSRPSGEPSRGKAYTGDGITNAPSWLGHDWYGGGTATSLFDPGADVPECTCEGCKDVRAKIKAQGENGG